MKFSALLLSLVFLNESKPLEYVAPIPSGLTKAQVAEASIGCMDCHGQTDAPSMHASPSVMIGCTHCHGGDASIRATNLKPNTPEYKAAYSKAHVLPKRPENWPNSANPELSYANLMEEPAEFVKFINPGDIRVARETCGGCHAEMVHAVERSLMTTSAMLWGGASYNNNILPYKNYVLGESYDRNGKPRELKASFPITPEQKARGALPKLLPLPAWEMTKPGDVFRVFERGGQFIRPTFPEIGIPEPYEVPGRPDIRASNRGPATGQRISVPVLNIHKTRLNDPHLSMLGTNDHPGDYRSSGCTACHVVYANDRDPRHSGPYAKYGHEGLSISKDPTIPKDRSGHPLKHEFTRAIPTSQCMVCHMHQPNMFVNTYLGYTMWDYETDADKMWPKEQEYPSHEEYLERLLYNPEEANVRGKWSDRDFLKQVSEMNDELDATQFADYHGHGWNFRAVFKRDKKGHLLDEDGNIVDFNDPEKFKKAVHMADIHVDYGMHCVDCHFQQDGHGDGHIYGEVAQAVEIKCQDCHGTATEKATLRTSGPAAKNGGRNLLALRTPWGERRFFWRAGKLYQRSGLEKDLIWQVSQVRDSVTKGHPEYNQKSARAKTMQKLKPGQTSAEWGSLPSSNANLAHSNDKMSCYSCHSSWITSCAGCHLPIEANWKSKTKHYEGKTTRNLASYNPQVVRDDVYQLGLHGPAKDGKIVPVRSSSALVLSSTDINRQKIYIQQPPTAASGHSSQAFAPHFPHTVRKTETKTCTECHISEDNDNNAWLTQLFLYGTNFMNFMGYNVYVAEGKAGLEAIQVTEWQEPQAVIGSYLHRYAYPDWYQAHQENKQELKVAHSHRGNGGSVNTIQLRGEYLFTTAGKGGFRVYDVANIANKGFSQRIISAPFSPWGHNTHVATKDATSFALPTTMPIAPFREQPPENMETPMHPIYHYALIADSKEGLILVNVDTFQDGEPRNNNLKRALTWNKDGVLTGAQFIETAGTNVFVLTKNEVVILDLDQPLEPKIVQRISFNNPKSLRVQFRYAFVVDADGFHTLDITTITQTQRLPSASIKLKDARNLYLARTYAYVAAGMEGLVILDIEKPEKPSVYMQYDGGGKLFDTYDVKLASTNASLFAYVADGRNGLYILQLTDPDRVPGFYGFSPEVKPKIIAHRKTNGPAIALSKALDRDRAVDETGHQISVFGRIGSRPFTRKETEAFFLTNEGKVYKVTDN